MYQSFVMERILKMDFSTLRIGSCPLLFQLLEVFATLTCLVGRICLKQDVLLLMEQAWIGKRVINLQTKSSRKHMKIRKWLKILMIGLGLELKGIIVCCQMV